MNSEKYMCVFENGIIGMNDIMVFLFDFFDNEFEDIALKNHAEKRIYPTLLPLNDFQKTGYLKTSPQYAIFCSDVKREMEILEGLENDIIKNRLEKSLSKPQYALSPAACLHVYIEHKNKTLNEPKTYTFIQNVFRNEGSEEYNEVGRLRDYHVREIVFLGTHRDVVKKRKKILDLTVEFVEKLGMQYKTTVACDPFILPKVR